MATQAQDEGKEKQSKVSVSSRQNRKRKIAGLLKLLLKTVILICAQDEGKEKQSKIAVSSRHNRKWEIAGLLKLLLKTVIMFCAQDEGREKQSKVSVSQAQQEAGDCRPSQAPSQDNNVDMCSG